MTEPTKRGRPAKASFQEFIKAAQRAEGVKGPSESEEAKPPLPPSTDSGVSGPLLAQDEGLSESAVTNVPGDSTQKGSPSSFKSPSADGLGTYTLSTIKPRLNEAIEHLEAILGLVQGFNGNHELIPNWCIKCDAERVHGDQACPCPCHEARQFLDATKKELEMPRL